MTDKNDDARKQQTNRPQLERINSELFDTFTPDEQFQFVGGKSISGSGAGTGTNNSDASGDADYDWGS
jgi:hypothetical protein